MASQTKLPKEIIPSPFNPTGAPPKTKEEAVETRVRHMELIQRLERLRANEDFSWFMAFVKKGADICLREGSDIDHRDIQTRDAYMQRFAGLNSMRTYVDEQINASREAIENCDERLRQLQS